MNQQMAESVMHVFNLHFAALARERKEKALERIKRQRFFSPVRAPIDEAAAAFIRHITTPELEPQHAAGAELDRFFLRCRRPADVEKAAYEFAARMIPEAQGGSPFWANAARQVLIASLVELQSESPENWGFVDLSKKLTRPVGELAEAARLYFPEALKALSDGQQNVTSAGVLSYLNAIFRPAIDAADLDWLIDALDPVSCQPDELDQLFIACRRAGNAEKAAYLVGVRDVRMRVSLLEGTDEWRALESVANQSEISSSSQAVACGLGK